MTKIEEAFLDLSLVQNVNITHNNLVNFYVKKISLFNFLV